MSPLDEDDWSDNGSVDELDDEELDEEACDDDDDYDSDDNGCNYEDKEELQTKVRALLKEAGAPPEEVVAEMARGLAAAFGGDWFNYQDIARQLLEKSVASWLIVGDEVT